MTRQRLRPAYTADELTALYPVPHEHRRWQDHVIRVQATVGLARELLATQGGASTGADLSCGDAAILRALDVPRRYLGDLAPGYEYRGPIEATLEHMPDVDLFVCCETLEHLDDPDAVLKAVRDKTRLLVLSTPVEAWDDSNPEHYWAWSRPDVDEMLTAAGFEVVEYADLDFRPFGAGFYVFGIWGCR